METDRGFIRAIIGIAIALIILKFAFNLDLIEWLEDARVQAFFRKIFEFARGVWDNRVLPIFR